LEPGGRIRKILPAIILLGLLSALYLLGARLEVEEQNKTVEVAVNYAEVQELAHVSGRSMAETLLQLKEQGVTGMLFKEDTLNTLSQVTALPGGGLKLLPGFSGAEIAADFTYLVMGERTLAERILTQYQLKFGPARLLEVDGFYLVELPVNQEQFVKQKAQLGFGFDPAGLKLAEDLGFNLLVQVRSWPGATAKSLAAVLAPLEDYPALAAVLFNDSELPGYPDRLPDLAAAVKKLGVPVAQIEFSDQKGFTQLARLLDKDAVRLHAISEGEMQQYSPDQALDRFTLAARERNMRILFVRLFMNQPPETVMDTNLSFLGRLTAELHEAGFELGRAEPFADLPVSRWPTFLAGLAVIAAAVLLAEKLGLYRAGLVLGALGLLAWGGLLFADPIPAQKLIALAAALVYPTGAVLWAGERSGGGLSRTLAVFAGMSLISLAGGLLVAGLLSDLNFMLQLEQFLGVKAAHLVPPVLVVLIFYFWRQPDHGLERFKVLWRSPATWGLLFIGAVVVATGAFYLLRTGNDAAPVLPIEASLREGLQNLLSVRPRTKEFLIGHPLMLLALYLGRRDQYLLLLAAGTIGQVSLVNTMAHIHTPLLISLVRVAHGLWLGLLLGLVLILVWQGLRYLDRRWLKSGWFDA